ncbi:uncharacterized protein LOC123986073 [Micropterus dolomieu]|uniref:uncharacterized protein LOC123986073 n=1 Tax=Micropterus dolomieu TaxID=147949 RepID=UPI001E8D2E95|nr:uncharacterized protein LOC123986073 [Micropterus dolomieu]
MQQAFAHEEEGDSKKPQGAHRQKTNYTANHQVLKLPIKTLQVSKPTSQSANLNCILELKSQVCDLQQQLNEARTENKLLKRIQHRHTVALQHFQDSEGSLSQDLERNLELCQASFNRQIATEQRKINEVSKISCYLREQIYQLSRDLQTDLQAEKARSFKQMGWPFSLPRLQVFGSYNILRLKRLEEKGSSLNWESLVTENPETEVSANVTFEEKHQEDTEACADTSEHNSQKRAQNI